LPAFFTRQILRLLGVDRMESYTFVSLKFVQQPGPSVGTTIVALPRKSLSSALREGLRIAKSKESVIFDQLKS
jgi:hypothetical protein